MLNKTKKINKTPLVFQYMETECGLACLSILLKYYGVTSHLQTLREQAGVSRDGCRATTLIALAEAAGCRAEAYSVELDTLRELTQPVILHWRFSHYIVFEGIKGDKVYINDPAFGRQVVTLQELDSAFTGIVIAIEPTEYAVKHKQSLLQQVKQYILIACQAIKTGRWLNTMALMMLSTLPLILSSLNSVYINHVLLGGKSNWLLVTLLLSAGISVGLMLSTLLQQWLEFESLSVIIQKKISLIFTKVLEWPVLLFQLRPVSEFIIVMNSLEIGLRSKLEGKANITANAFLVLVLSVGLLVLNPRLAALMIMLLIGFMLGMHHISRKKMPLEQQLMSAEAYYFSMGLAFLNNLENIVIAGMQETVYEHWQQALSEKTQIQQKIHLYQAMQNALTKTYQAFNFVIMMLVGLSLAKGSHQPLSLVLAFAAVTSYLSKGINTLTDSHRRVQTANAQLLRVDDVSQIKQDARFQIEMKQLTVQQPPLIKLRDLEFSYNKTQQPVLKINELIIQSGEHIAFVGGSGSGKSTLAKLLAGLYLPDRGEIYFDTLSTKACHPAELSRFVSVVTQEASVLSLTLYENLTLGNPACPPEKVHEILQWVGLEKLAQKRGLNTLLLANNHQLSGGEIQRINLARALIQDAPVLILDEATSSIEAALESNIIDKIKSLNKTVIYIAHRLSTIQHCDRIMVLDQGAIVESGTHHGLLALKKTYASLLQAEAAMQAEVENDVRTRAA